MSLEPTLILAFVWPTWLIGILTVIFLVFCILMVLTVLIQKPQGGGLGSAFGGGASAGQTAFGTKTGDALTIFTIAVFVIYLLTAIVLNWAARPQPISLEPAGTMQAVPIQIPMNGDSPIVLPAQPVPPAGEALSPAADTPPTQEPPAGTPASDPPPSAPPPADAPGRA
jgi:preprotein translocase subunit SecG